jgi:hypothetical protein
MNARSQFSWICISTRYCLNALPPGSTAVTLSLSCRWSSSHGYSFIFNSLEIMTFYEWKFDWTLKTCQELCFTYLIVYMPWNIPETSGHPIYYTSATADKMINTTAGGLVGWLKRQVSLTASHIPEVPSMADMTSQYSPSPINMSPTVRVLWTNNFQGGCNLWATFRNLHSTVALKVRRDSAGDLEIMAPKSVLS